MNSYVEKIREVTDFSGYQTITDKFKKILLDCNLLSRFKNESLLLEWYILIKQKLPTRLNLHIFSNEKRVTLAGKPKEKSEKKKIDKTDKGKDRKSKKRSAQIAEISIM